MAAVNVRRLLLGKRLHNADLAHQAISRPVGLAVFASDALSSTAYATEEVLIILSMAVGGAAMWSTGGTIFGLSLPITIAIAILLAIVTISYRQTIYAYPNGGGAYIVARDNFGELPAQIAGAALLTDYILTVSVSVSAGVAQISSAFPNLHAYRVPMAVAVIIIVTTINLRGVKESGRILAMPSYFFLGIMFVTLGIGLIRLLGGNLPTVQDVEALQHTVVEPLGLFLILRAFSSGCTALTGIEAISNGITAFKKPRSHNAAVTLVWMSSILIVLFLGITFVANQIQAVPSETETVISQIARTIHGEGTVLYFLTLAGTALILLMAANTAYAGFPRLAALQAGDGFLPRQLTMRGGRLVFSWGIMVLSGAAILLVILLDAKTTALIPLYAVGVFLSFTISQAGMVKRALRVSRLRPGEKVERAETTLEYTPNWRVNLAVSATGALCTFVVMIVFAVTKFSSGAWFVVILIPALVYVFFRIHYHYKEVARALSLSAVPVDRVQHKVQTLILVDNVHAETARMVNFAQSMEHPWKAIHIGISPERIEQVTQKWNKYFPDGELVILPSPYRLLSEPLRDYIQSQLDADPDSYVHVIMGHLVMDTFWEQALHQNSALLFNLTLSRMERVVVTNVPYQIHGFDEEEDEEASIAGGDDDKLEAAKQESAPQDSLAAPLEPPPASEQE